MWVKWMYIICSIHILIINKNIYVLYCNACCYYNATVACLNWMSCFYTSWNFGSFGKYRNRTELPETEVARFLPLKRTDRYLLSRNRSSVGTEEPNRTPKCPALTGASLFFKKVNPAFIIESYEKDPFFFIENFKSFNQSKKEVTNFSHAIHTLPRIHSQAKLSIWFGFYIIRFREKRILYAWNIKHKLFVKNFQRWV